MVASFPCFVRARWRILVLSNVLFFTCVLVTMVFSNLFLQQPLYTGWHPGIPDRFLTSGWFMMALGIFIFTLVANSFLLVTLPGMLFFPLSTGFLLYRAYVWGTLLCSLPTRLFAAALPTVILEGEAYALAVAAGTVLGASWIFPKRVFKDKSLSRIEAFELALEEGLRTYATVALLLIISATVETIAISYL